MALKVASIDELDPDLVLAAQAELSQLIQERHPEVELTRGVIHDIVAFFAGGISGAVNQTEVDRVRQSNSLLAIENNPELADDDLVDAVLSNYNLTRKVGTRARGDVTIVVEGSTTVVIAADELYIANGINYRTDTTITARPPGTTIVATSERALVARGDGSYEFTVPATAEDVGEEANIGNGTKLVPDVTPPRFVTAFATSGFTGGTSSETNEQAIERLRAGIAAEGMSGRLNIDALIRGQATFADIKELSIIGYGDAEMTRDQHSIFPVSMGGRIDIYARNDAIPETVALRKEATLIAYDAVGSAGSTWQFAITRTDAPGFYEVAGIRLLTDPADIAGFEVTLDQRGFDLGDDTWKPDILTTEEAAYTKYQTAVIQFTDSSTIITADVVSEGKAEYNIDIITQPLIDDMQDFVASEDQRHLASDVLVKSAVPCFVSINCDIYKNTNESAPDLDPIKVELARVINNTGFPGTIYASQVADTIHDFLTGSQAIGQVDMHGRIRRPDGDDTYIRDNWELAVPNLPSVLVTPQTTTFILYPEDIGLNVLNR